MRAEGDDGECVVQREDEGKGEGKVGWKGGEKVRVSVWRSVGMMARPRVSAMMRAAACVFA